MNENDRNSWILPSNDQIDVFFGASQAQVDPEAVEGPLEMIAGCRRCCLELECL